MFSIPEILDIAIRIEKNGEKFYRDAREKVSSDALASLLEWLAGEEVEHCKVFTNLRQSLPTDAGNRQFEEMSRALLQDILGDQKFSLSDIDLSEVSGVERLLEHAIEFEHDTVLFYEMMSGIIDDMDTLACLGTLIDEERNHIRVLNEHLEKEKGRPKIS